MEFVNRISEIFFQIWNFSIDIDAQMIYNVVEVIVMLHDILNARKKELGMDLDGIVRKSGVPKGTVSKIMSGITPNPSIENVKAIAHALGLSLSDLDDKITSLNLSEEERAFLDSFRTLDAPGKAAVQAVLESQQQRIREYGPADKKSTSRRIPLMQGTDETEMQMRYQARREREELAKEEIFSTPDAP